MMIMIMITHNLACVVVIIVSQPTPDHSNHHDYSYTKYQRQAGVCHRHPIWSGLNNSANAKIYSNVIANCEILPMLSSSLLGGLITNVIMIIPAHKTIEPCICPQNGKVPAGYSRLCEFSSLAILKQSTFSSQKWNPAQSAKECLC